MIDLLLSAGVIITVDGERRVIGDGAIAVDDGRILEVGQADSLGRHEARQHLSHPDGIVMPGLIDAHGHAGHSLVRTLGGDDLERWLEACGRLYLHGSTSRFWFADARLSALERLVFGTTTGVSMLGGAGDTIRSDDPRYAIAHADGVAEVGIRDVMVVGPGAPPFPKRTTDVEAGTAVESTFADQMATAQTLLDRYEGDDRQKVALTFPTLTPELVGDAGVRESAEAVVALAAAMDALIVQDGHRADTVVASDRLGLLGARSVLSHSIDLGQVEIELLAERGAAVAHNPSAVFSQFGTCPVPELLDAGVTVALGSDATGPDRSSDMFRHMFQATRYHRAVRRDPALLPPGRVIEMATIDAANALGMPHLGSIEPGKSADLIVIDARKPHLTPLIHPVHQVVYYATGADVATVIVGGQVLMRDRVLTDLDMEEILTEARVEHDAAIARSGLDGLRSDRPGLWGNSRYPGGFEPPDLGR